MLVCPVWCAGTGVIIAVISNLEDVRLFRTRVAWLSVALVLQASSHSCRSPWTPFDSPGWLSTTMATCSAYMVCVSGSTTSISVRVLN